MVRVPLTVVPAKRDRHDPHMPRGRLKRLTARLMRAKTLRGAIGVLRQNLRFLTGHWHKYVRRLAEGLADIVSAPNAFDTPLAVFYLKGNTKLPFASFSALPEYTCPGAGDCLEWCYSFTGWRYPGTWCRQVMNTLLLRHAPHVIAHHFGLLGEDIILRLYVDGDFDSDRTVAFWFDLLRSRPDVRAYGYSKSWDLLWEYAQAHPLPPNYRLNLSSGGREQRVSAEQMMNLSITRGHFVAVPVAYRSPGKRGNVGFERYADPEYHRLVRLSASALGMPKVFSCPGKCGECAGGHHACGSDKFKGVVVAIGVH